MRVGVYLRISSDPTGQQLGVARQREDCLTLCATKSWEPVEYVDNDVSATSGRPRPAYQRMLSDIRDGALGGVVAWDLDRLHRRPIELESFMSLADEHHLALATVSGDVDLSTAQGRLMARLKGSVAAHETEHKAARQRRAGRQRADAGRPAWRSAFGYTPGPDGPMPDPQTAPLVKRAYADVIAGASLGSVCRTWNAAGVRTATGKNWDTQTLNRFLTNARNAGLRVYNRPHSPCRDDIVGPGTWQPLVDADTYWALRAVLDSPERKKPGRRSVRKHLLSGVMACGKCGDYLAGQPVRRRNGEQVLCYTCHGCRGVTVQALDVTPIIYGIVGGRLAQPDAVDLLRSADHDRADAERLRHEAAALHAQIAEAEREYDEGVIDGRRLAGRIEAVSRKLDAISAAQQDVDKARVFDGIPIGTPAAVKAIENLPPDRFRVVLDVLMTITVAPAGKGRRPFQPERLQVAWK